MAQNYGDSSVSALIGEERVRLRPAAMLGTSGIEGARHGFTEMYGNALDERNAGYGNKFDVVYYEDGSMSIRDYGRGVPMGWNEKVQNWNWHAIYNELYAGAKYSNGQWYLRSIEPPMGWAEWKDKQAEALRRALIEEFGFDIQNIAPEGRSFFTSIGDIDVSRGTDGNVYYTRTNNASWSMVTWDMLNARLNYLASVGLNGLGAASTQYTSEFFEVKSYRDGKVKSRSFSHGKPLVNGVPFDMFRATPDEVRAIPEEVEDSDEPSGTFVHWKPDDTVFDNVDIGGDWLYNTCRDICNVASVNLHFENRQTGFIVDLEAGNMEGLLKEKSGALFADGATIHTTQDFTHGVTRVEGNEFVYVARCDAVFACTKGAAQVGCFHNSVRMNSGVQYQAIGTAIGDFLKDKGKRSGVKIEPNDYNGIFSVFVSSYSNYASFRGQTKDGVADDFIYSMIYRAIYEKLSGEYSRGSKDIVDAVDKVIEEARIRIATKEWQNIKRDAEKVKKERLSSKFTSCRAYENKEYDKAELWITEGDSAGDSVVNARDGKTQAVLPIRGKGLNVSKSSIDKVLKNKEIREIFACIGTGFDLNIRGEKTFNLEDLRFDKIIFATDADEDGYQIRVLLFLMFYRLAPKLITTGHIYIAETPRFGITLTDGKIIWCKDDAERDKMRAKYGPRIAKISRYKGLGEFNADMLRETTVLPGKRNLIQLNCDFNNMTEVDMIDALFGADKYHQRKEILSSILHINISDVFDDDALGFTDVDSEDSDEEGEEDDA